MKVILIGTNAFDVLLAVNEENKTVYLFREAALQDFANWDEDGRKVYKPLSEITADFDETNGEEMQWEEWEEIEKELYDYTSKDFEVLEEIELQ